MLCVHPTEDLEKCKVDPPNISFNGAGRLIAVYVCRRCGALLYTLRAKEPPCP